MKENLDTSNFEIEIIIENSNNDGLKNNFSVFSLNKINKFINFHQMMKENRDSKYK